MPPRQISEAIVFVLRTSIQWKALPRHMGSSSAVHKHFPQWQEAGFFHALGKQGLTHYDPLVGIAWEWQSIDGCKVESPLGQDAVGAIPVDREKNGLGRHSLVNGRGVALSLVIVGANRHDVSQVAAVLEGKVVAQIVSEGEEAVVEHRVPQCLRRRCVNRRKTDTPEPNSPVSADDVGARATAQPTRDVHGCYGGRSCHTMQDVVDQGVWSVGDIGGVGIARVVVFVGAGSGCVGPSGGLWPAITGDAWLGTRIRR